MLYYIKPRELTRAHSALILPTLYMYRHYARKCGEYDKLKSESESEYAMALQSEVDEFNAL